MANSSFFKNDGVTTSLQTNLTDKAADAEKLAINPEDDQFTLSDGTTTGYSALHHKEKAIDAQTAAEAAETAAETAKTAAETAKTGAETAKTAAETAKTGAETAQTAAETAETNAETAETNASTSATNAATSETNAATSATTASTKAAEASTSATNAATSETNAETAKTAAENAKTAAETAKTAAENAKTAAETAETNAETAESNASTSETNAANSATSAATSATTAATKASEASTSATNAATSATTASTKASEASTSAAAAAASQTAAAASAASAASTYDQFDDRYLGTKSSDPTVDNDGNALVEGALYFSSTDNAMQVYDGSEWIAASAAGSVSITEYHYTATANQTAFSGSGLSYTVDNLVVIMNGVILQNGSSKDFTATDGSTVTLTSGAAAGDEIHIIVFKSFTTADMVSKTNGGAYSGSVDFTGGLEINGTAVTATAAELNTMDGITATTAELNTLDGITATTAELNTLDGVTATASEINTLDGITASTAELNLLDGVTATTAELNYVDGVTSNIQTQIDNISSELVDDTSPSLGGNLDVAGNEITNATTNGDIVLSTGGTGNVKTKIGTKGSSLNPTALAFNRSVGDGEIYNSSSNAFQFNHSSNKLALQVYNSAGTQVTANALAVDSAGKVGVGTASPTYRLTVEDTSSTPFIQIKSANTHNSGLLFSDPQGNPGQIRYNHSTNRMAFEVNGSERMAINSSGGWDKAPAGTVLQVVQDVESNAQSYTGTGESTILSATITPKSSSSKILILCTTHINSLHGYRYAYGKLYRGSSTVFNGNSSGNRTPVTVGHTGNSDGHDRYVLHGQSFQVLDSPATTSAITYNMKMGNSYYNTTVYNNRPSEDSNAGWHQRGASSLILMEIAG